MLLRATVYILDGQTDQYARVILQRDVSGWDNAQTFRDTVREEIEQQHGSAPVRVEFGPVGEPWSYRRVRRSIAEALSA